MFMLGILGLGLGYGGRAHPRQQFFQQGSIWGSMLCCYLGEGTSTSFCIWHTVSQMFAV